MPCDPNGTVHREVGVGTTSDPLIMWLVTPPRSKSRTLGNEQVARDLGHLGYRYVWIRACDHGTTRITMSTRRGGRRRQMVHTDSHITVYCGRTSDADMQGDVFIFVERDGTWRIMRNSERSNASSRKPGKGVELYDYP